MGRSESEIVFQVHITQEAFLAYYQGVARSVVTQASDGRTVRFPARLLQPFLTRQGIHGVFVIRYDENNKFKEIRKIG